MTKEERSLSSFDPEEANKIIEELRAKGLKYVPGDVRILKHGTFSSLVVNPSKPVLMGDRQAGDRRGLFLLLSTHDLVEFLKETFDLETDSD